MSSGHGDAVALNKEEAINIVGAGVFGLSTAIHLAQRGYKSVTVFDKQDYHSTRYNPFRGCDSASADINKIFRSAYGAQKEYQALSIEATEAWNAWNCEIAHGSIPPGLKRTDKVYINNGNLSLTDQEELPSFEVATIENMTNAGYPNTQLNTYDADHVKIAAHKGFSHAIDPFDRKSRGQGYLGVLDTTGGTLVADKACYFALDKAQRLGVKFVFGEKAGVLESFMYSSPSSDEVVGIRTLDGRSHRATRTILACGGWTPSLLPDLDSVCETTAGSVVIIKLPKDLTQRYSAANFPSWTYKVRDGAEGGLYGFPATEEGYLKIGYRGTKYTNPKVQKDGLERSVPVTRYTAPERIVDSVPSQALGVIKQFIADFLPDIPARGIDIDMTRLCWYTDSWDNHFVIDHVPGKKNLLVATAGSGHAYKYLPNIGAWVADIMEGKGLERQLVKSWRWRTRPRQQDEIINSIMEGSRGKRSLSRTEMSAPQHLKLGPQPSL